MQYARLGDTGLVVSRLAFGAMTFGSGNIPAVYKVGRDDAHALVERALAAGVNFFDTADAYADGQSETMLGEALRARRKDVVISTKVGLRVGSAVVQSGLSRRHVLASCEASLRRLGTDYIDVYIVHRFDRFTPLEETALAWLLRRPGVTTILLGASKASQLDDNLAAASLELGDDEMALLDRESPHALYYPSWFNQVVRDQAAEEALGA